MKLRAGPRFRIISGPEGETLELSIAGAKRADRTGQDVRILTMSSSGSEAARVQDLIAHLAGLKATVRVNTLELAGCVTISARAGEMDTAPGTIDLARCRGPAYTLLFSLCLPTKVRRKRY